MRSVDIAKAACVCFAAVILLAIACSDDEGGDDATATLPPPTLEAACSSPRPHDAGESEQSITSGGIERRYILRVPPTYDGSEPAPLVLLFHGYALTARFTLDYSELGQTADQAGFILVAPEGAGDPQHWNAALLPDGADDVQFVRDLLAELDSELCVDASLTFATGFSNGSAMSLRLSCDLPERISAIGLVSEVDAHCEPQVPVIVFQGAEDPLAPIDGGGEYFPGEGFGTTPPVRETVEAWAQGSGCDVSTTDVTRPAAHVELTTYRGCDQGDGAVQLYVVEDGGHAWPGGTTNVRKTTQEIDASELIWEFFSGQAGSP